MLSLTLSQQLERALHGLQYGTVQLIVHEARIVRIERIERIRLPADVSAAQAGLTDSSEAITQTAGQPTIPLEVRHDDTQKG